MTVLEWNSASDWDNAQSESGVVHEATANTDHDDATILKKGYAAASPYEPHSLLVYYPEHEDSGTTLNDFSGNGNDASVSGATPNVSALLGTTSYDYDGSGDEATASFTAVDVQSGWTLVAWVKLDTKSSDAEIADFYDADGDGFAGLRYNDSGDNFESFTRDDGQNVSSTMAGTTSPSTGTWYQVAAVFTGSERKMYVNATEEFTESISVGSWTLDTLISGDDTSDSRRLDGQIWDLRFYQGGLTQSELQTLYDVVDTDGTMTTGVKTS